MAHDRQSLFRTLVDAFDSSDRSGCGIQHSDQPQATLSTQVTTC